VSYNRNLALLARFGGPVVPGVQALRDLAFTHNIFLPGAWVSPVGAAAVLYRWDPASTDADDGDVTVAATGHATAGRWIKSPGPVAVEAELDCGTY
jgi:hypothetical protein